MFVEEKIRRGAVLMVGKRASRQGRVGVWTLLRVGSLRVGFMGTGYMVRGGWWCGEGVCGGETSGQSGKGCGGLVCRGFGFFTSLRCVQNDSVLCF